MIILKSSSKAVLGLPLDMKALSWLHSPNVDIKLSGIGKRAWKVLYANN